MKLIATLSLLSIFIGCTSKENELKNKEAGKVKIPSNRYTPLLGTWVKNLDKGYRAMEIRDSTNVLIYNFYNNKYSDTLVGVLEIEPALDTPLILYTDTLLDTLTIEPASSAHWISIKFSTWRFYYKWLQDTLIQADEQSEQEKYIKKKINPHGLTGI